MAKKVKQLRSEAFAIKEQHPIASQTDTVRQFGYIIYARPEIYNNLALVLQNVMSITKFSPTKTMNISVVA